MPDPEYLVIDPAEVLRALKAKGMGGFARTTVLAVLHEQGEPAREERRPATTTTLNDSVTHWSARSRRVTDWREDSA